MREWILFVLLALAAGAVVFGVSMLSPAAAWIVGGVLVAVLAWLQLGEVGE